MELANVTIVHRFLSPAWYETIKRHIAAANKYDRSGHNTLFEAIVALDTGEALLFCPSALLAVQKSRQGRTPIRLGNDFARIQIRKRQTLDGGKSVMASGSGGDRDTTIAIDVPMFIVTRPPSPPRRPRYPPRGGGYQSYSPGTDRHNTRASVVGQRNTSSAGHGSSQTAQVLPAVDQLRPVVKEYIRKQFRSGWTSVRTIGWNQLFGAVDKHFNVAPGENRASEMHRNVCFAAARQQMVSCIVIK